MGWGGWGARVPADHLVLGEATGAAGAHRASTQEQEPGSKSLVSCSISRVPSTDKAYVS